MVNAGFSRYLIEGFNIGIPPTEAMLMKKNKMLTIIRQNPIEYISSLLNSIAILPSFFRKNLGIKILEGKLKDGKISLELNEAMNLLNDVHKNSTVLRNVYNSKNLDLVVAYKTDYNNSF